VVHSKYSWVPCFCIENTLQRPKNPLEKHLNSATILPSKNRHILAEKMGFPAFCSGVIFFDLNGFLRFLAVTLVTIYDENGQPKGEPLPCSFWRKLTHFQGSAALLPHSGSDSFFMSSRKFRLILGEIVGPPPSSLPRGTVKSKENTNIFRFGIVNELYRYGRSP